MTREEIMTRWEALTPRERDAWVAEAVMGWKPIGDGRMKSSDNFLIRPIPGYSTDIGAAWQVAEKMNGKSGFSLGRAGDYESDRKWNARVGRNEWEEADTAPEAICKAALLAVMSG